MSRFLVIGRRWKIVWAGDDLTKPEASLHFFQHLCFLRCRHCHTVGQPQPPANLKAISRIVHRDKCLSSFPAEQGQAKACLAFCPMTTLYSAEPTCSHKAVVSWHGANLDNVIFIWVRLLISPTKQLSNRLHPVGWRNRSLQNQWAWAASSTVKASESADLMIWKVCG